MSMAIDSIFKYFLSNIIYNRNLNYAEIKVLCFILSGVTLILLLSLATLCIFPFCSYIKNSSLSPSIKKFTFLICLFFLSIFTLLISLILILLPSLRYSINKISFTLCCSITTFISIFCFFLMERLRKKLSLLFTNCPASYVRISDSPPDMPDKNKSCRKKSKILTVFNALALLYASIAFPLLLENICFFSWSPYGLNIFGQGVTTKAYHDSKGFPYLGSVTGKELSPVCPPGPPCHVYATLSGDASSSFFLNLHTSTKTSEALIFYDTADYYKTAQYLRFSSKTTYWTFDLEPIAARNVHAVHIGDLLADTEYIIHVVYEGHVQYNSTYKTLPASSDVSRNIIVAAGGDVGSTEPAQKLTNQLENINPDVVVVGGDGAYDNGMRTCYYSYDLFLGMFEGLNKKLQRIVPIILGIGNHELGIHSISTATVTVTDTEGPLYFLYFPQHLTNDSKIPSPGNRKTYFPQIIGNTLHLSLDSGYMAAFNGTQADWIKEVAGEHVNLSKFAHYHVPTIPSCHLEEDNPDSQMNLAYNSWSLSFEDLRFEAAFEYHYHLFKKTFPVKNKTVDANGVLYLGEGKWGASGNRCLQVLGAYNQSGLLETAQDVYHVWIMNISRSSWEYYPINPEGEIFYEKSQKEFFIQAD